MTLAVSGAALAGHPWPSVCVHARVRACVSRSVSRKLIMRECIGKHKIFGSHIFMTMQTFPCWLAFLFFSVHLGLLLPYLTKCLIVIRAPQINSPNQILSHCLWAM
jgi:hypothetical protein